MIKSQALTPVNSRLDKDIETAITILGNKTIRDGNVTVLTSNRIRDCNDFDTPNLVKPSQKNGNKEKEAKL